MQKNNTIDFNKDVVAKVVGNKDNAFNVPLKPAQQISNQLSFDIPPTEDQNWLPNTAEELAKAAYFLCKTVSDDASNKLYKQIKKMVSEENSKEEDNYIVARFQKNESFLKGNKEMKIIATERKLQEIAEKIIRKISILNEVGPSKKELDKIALQQELESAEDEEDIDPEDLELAKELMSQHLEKVGKNLKSQKDLRKKRAEEQIAALEKRKQDKKAEYLDAIKKVETSSSESKKRIKDVYLKMLEKQIQGLEKYQEEIKTKIKRQEEADKNLLPAEEKKWREKWAQTQSWKPKTGSKLTGILNPKPGWRNKADEDAAERIVQFIEKTGRVPIQFQGGSLDKYVRKLQLQQQLPAEFKRPVNLSDFLSPREIQEYDKLSQESPEVQQYSLNKLKYKPKDVSLKTQAEKEEEAILMQQDSLFNKAISRELSKIKSNKTPWKIKDPEVASEYQKAKEKVELRKGKAKRGQIERSIEGEYGGFSPNEFWKLLASTGGVSPITGLAREKSVNPSVVKATDFPRLMGKMILSYSLLKMLPKKLQPSGRGDVKGNELFDRLLLNKSILTSLKKILSSRGVNLPVSNEIKTVNEFRAAYVKVQDVDPSELSSAEREIFKNVLTMNYLEVNGDTKENQDLLRNIFGKISKTEKFKEKISARDAEDRETLKKLQAMRAEREKMKREEY